jgi:hypothetical protein
MAVLIDADGMSPKDTEKVFRYLPSLGRVTVQRIYGNFSDAQAAKWAKLLRGRGLIARHMTPLVRGKNAGDIALAVDAMELLLCRKVRAFVLVANDTDFTPLVHRLREDGAEVYGFGHSTTPEPFRAACTAFWDVRQPILTDRPQKPLGAFWTQSPKEAEDIVLTVLSMIAPDRQPVPLTVFKSCLVAHHPGFDPRVFSRRTLKDLLNELPTVKVTDHQGEPCVRLQEPGIGTG